jgi:predicted membrane protein
MEGPGRPRSIAPQFVMGVLIIVVGVLFTLENLGFIEADAYLRYWPVGLIAVGLLKLWSGGRGATFPGLLFLFGGTWLLLQAMAIVDISLWSLWPVLLILAGASMVWRGVRGPAVCQHGAPDTDDHSTVSALAVLGGVNRRNNSRTFRGGDLTAVMGGCQIDLRGAAIEGEAVIDVFAMWGGIEIKVPEGWSVSGRVTPILGGYEDKTHPPREAPTQWLTVRGMVIMGGVEIKN